MQLQDVPLSDRDFTWSNMQTPSIMTKIDRVFINADWDLSMPDSSLQSLPRVTSDHIPLIF